MGGREVAGLESNLRRRDFLAFGAGAALLPSVSWAGLESCRSELTIGFCRKVEANSFAKVVPAERLRAGQEELTRCGARLTIHGLTGDPLRLDRLGIQALDLRVCYRLNEAGCDDVDVRVWSYQRLPVEQNGPPNTFTVPVTDGLRLSLEIETPLGIERREAVLVTRRESGRQKLRTGRYLIAPGDSLPQRFNAEGSEPLIELSVEAA